MFFTNIKLAKKYNYLNEKFLKAYDWLESHDLNSLPAGKYEIEDVEAHDKFFDIQYLIDGVEFFGICDREGLKVKEAKPENDVLFFEMPDTYGHVILHPDEFIVVAPEDAHMPGCCMDKPASAKKAVIKVRV